MRGLCNYTLKQLNQVKFQASELRPSFCGFIGRHKSYYQACRPLRQKEDRLILVFAVMNCMCTSMVDDGHSKMGLCWSSAERLKPRLRSTNIMFKLESIQGFNMYYEKYKVLLRLLVEPVDG